ncbi:MAG TPA: hypothetical protein VFZ61_20205 [Polyangiales bacterium]
MTMRKTLAYALVLGAALTVAPQLGSAVTPVIGTNNVNAVTTFDDAWATANTSVANTSPSTAASGTTSSAAAPASDRATSRP